MARKNNVALGAEGFLIGGIVGGLATLLFAPKSGPETRHDIYKYSRLARLKKRHLISDAKIQSNEMIKKAEEFLEKSRAFAKGKYNGTIDGLEREMEGIKAGFNKAIETYKNYSTRNTDNLVEEIFVDFDDPSVKNMDDEQLPKYEGMKRRRDK